MAEADCAFEDCRIYLTRRCNFNCPFCNLSSGKVKELPVEDWKTAFKNLEKVGFRTVKLLGGEPTLFEGLEELIKFANEKTKLECYLESNSCFGKDKFESLLDAGLKGYCTDVNSLKKISVGGKPNIGLKMMEALQKEGVKHLNACVVVSKANLQELPELVAFLSGKGFFVNLIPIHYGDQYKHWEVRSKDISPELKLTDRDRPALERAMEKIIEIKRAKGRIQNSESYLQDFPRYGIDLDWHCSKVKQVRIDADGAFRICCDVRGEVEKYNVVTIDKEKIAKFGEDWLKSKIRQDCPGCYYPPFYSEG